MNNFLRVSFIITVFLLAAVPALAVDGEVYFGAFVDSSLRAYPGGGEARYISGIEVGHRLWCVRPYFALETLYDGYNGDGSFHPASVRYDAGVDLRIWKGLSVEVSHMCWHPVDSAGTVEQYNRLMLRFRF